MTPRELIEAFGTLAEAPDGVKRLRELVLQLAVRGKLVPQDPADEPASKLLARIAKGPTKVRKGKRGVAAQAISEAPFDVPHDWDWASFSEVADIHSNLVDPANYRSAIHVAPDNIEKGTGRLLECRTIGEDSMTSSKHLFFAGQLLYSKIRPRLSKVVVVDFGGLCSADMYPIGARIDRRFLHMYMLSPTFVVLATADDNRLAMPKLNQGQLQVLPVPVPPLAEQHRIVAKVDELMAFLDKLEAAKTARDATRKALRDAALAALREADSPDDVDHAWGRIAEQMDELFAEPEDIAPLRQAVLQLAVRGRLVRQVEGDEPAGRLLARVAAQKEILLHAGMIPADKAPAPLGSAESRFQIPSGWSWCRLSALATIVTKGSSPKWQGVSYVEPPDGILFVTSENVGSGQLRLDRRKHVEIKFNEIEPRSVLRQGDLLMNIVGASIGRVCRYELTETANINQAVCLIRLANEAAETGAFLLHLLNSDDVTDQMFDKQVENARANLSLASVANFAIPLPPLAEQHRIVAKVDELMALLDKLESRLRESKRLQAAFAAAAVHHLHLAEN